MTTPQGWSYSGDPSSTEVDQVRFLMQDTDPDVPLLADLEVQYLIDRWMPLYDSLTFVASVGASVVSRRFAGVLNITADGVSVNTADLSTRYEQLALQLRQEYSRETSSGGPDITNLLVGSQFDDSIQPLAFSMGIHDNPEAGGQDMGGRSPRWVDGVVEG